MNKDSAGIKYQFADDIRIYEFIESIYKLPSNNPISPFRTVSDIVEFLRSQWAGLFQRFLQDQKRLEEVKALDEMKSIARTLDKIVGFLTEERRDNDEAIQQILFASHPVFYRFQELTKTPYRVFFSDEGELNDWLRARKWNPVKKDRYDDGSHREWYNEGGGKYMKLTEAVFDEEGKLKSYTLDNWKNSWLQIADIDEAEEVLSEPG